MNGRPGPHSSPRVTVPMRLPIPNATAALYRGLEGTAEAHPVYALAKMVNWLGDGDEWRTALRPPARFREVREYAFGLGVHALDGKARRDLAERTRVRRAAWLKSLESKGSARRLVLRASTEAVVWLASPGPLGLGLAIHHVYGFPIIPASSLKGLARRVARGVDARGADERYGSPSAVGQVAILDGLPCPGWRVQRDVMTPHFGKWYQEGKLPNDTEDPMPIPFLSIGAGSCFEVALLARGASATATLSAVTEDLRRGLDELGLGAKTAAGYGVFTLEVAHRDDAVAGATERVRLSGPAAPPRPARDPRAVEAETLIRSLKAHKVKPQMHEIARQLAGCPDAERRAIVATFRARLVQLGFKRKEITELLRPYPDINDIGDTVS